MMYIFEFYIFEYTFSNFYILLCHDFLVLLSLFVSQWNTDIDKTKLWRIWKWNVSFFF